MFRLLHIFQKAFLHMATCRTWNACKVSPEKSLAFPRGGGSCSMSLLREGERECCPWDLPLLGYWHCDSLLLQPPRPPRKGIQRRECLPLWSLIRTSVWVQERRQMSRNRRTVEKRAKTSPAEAEAHVGHFWVLVWVEATAEKPLRASGWCLSASWASEALLLFKNQN